jgi:hypothetical protein
MTVCGVRCLGDPGQGCLSCVCCTGCYSKLSMAWVVVWPVLILPSSM